MAVPDFLFRLSEVAPNRDWLKLYYMALDSKAAPVSKSTIEHWERAIASVADPVNAFFASRDNAVLVQSVLDSQILFLNPDGRKIPAADYIAAYWDGVAGGTRDYIAAYLQNVLSLLADADRYLHSEVVMEKTVIAMPEVGLLDLVVEIPVPMVNTETGERVDGVAVVHTVSDPNQEKADIHAALSNLQLPPKMVLLPKEQGGIDMAAFSSGISGGKMLAGGIVLAVVLWGAFKVMGSNSK